jgi:hypothetical protein
MGRSEKHGQRREGRREGNDRNAYQSARPISALIWEFTTRDLVFALGSGALVSQLLNTTRR